MTTIAARTERDQHLDKLTKFIEVEYPVMATFLKFHRTHKNQPGTLIRYPYLKNIFMDQSPALCIEKATQCGATEYLIARTFNRCSQGRNTFYVLPTFLLKNQFVTERIDKSIAYTPHYRALMKASDTTSESASLINIGMGAVAFVGSNSTAAFTSFPADDLIIDELDECDQNNIPMAPERLSASKNPTEVRVGNPTFDGFGIDAEYQKSDKKKWFIQCEHCTKWFSPDFFKNVIQDVGEGNYLVLDPEYEADSTKEIRLYCHECNRPVDRYKRGAWASSQKSSYSGFHISKLFSTNVKLNTLVEKFTEALKNDTKMQRFYNGDLGLPFTAKGSRIDFQILNACQRDYVMPETCASPCALGIDVGSVLHTVVINLATNQLVYIGALNNFEDDLADIFRRYNIIVGCIDALPDLHYARKVRNTYQRVFLVHIGKLKADTANEDRHALSVDRTAFLDEVKEALMKQTILLPKNADKLNPIDKNGYSEFYNMISNPIRAYDEEKGTYKWVEGSKPDHYLFALGFANLARKVLVNA